jgi:hypothetical protein
MVQCRNCGNHLLFRYNFTIAKVCEQCGHVVSSDLLDKSLYKPFPVPDEYCLDLIHKTVSLKKTQGMVTGRLRYFYTEGYLNKWPLCFEGKHLWICESMGHYFMLMPSQVGNFEKDLEVEDTVTHEGVTYSVDAIHQALGYSMEGELPDFDTYFSEFSSIECSNGKQILIIHQNPQDVQIFFTGMDITFNEIISILR